jgi:NAD-dependent deacetylase
MSLDDQVNQALALLAAARSAIALTGAGISTASGIPDFRTPSSGLWQHVNPLEVASLFAFRHRPQDFYDWIRPLARLMLEALPNAAHQALADLERCGPLKGIITQNIDMLHQKAGSQIIYEVHGHLREVTCIGCYAVFSSAPYWENFLESGEAPRCERCGSALKPNVILYGEQLPVTVLNAARKAIRSSDVMLIVGSSLEVAPAGDLPLLAHENGAKLVVINYEPTFIDDLADVVIRANVVEVLPRLAAAFVK